MSIPKSDTRYDMTPDMTPDTHQIHRRWVIKRLWRLVGYLSIILVTGCAPVYQNVSIDNLTLSPPSSLKEIPLKVAVVIPDENFVYTGLFLDGIPPYYASFPAGKAIRRGVLDVFPSIF